MLSKEANVAIKAAKEAGKVIRKYFKKEFSIKKKGKIDLVTDADIAAQKKVISVLSKTFPKDEFLAEESAKKDFVGKRVWIIDPLDGTTNFAHSFEWFATSIGLMVDNEPFVGVVFDPIRNHLYVTQKSKGAFLNGKQIFVSKNSVLIDSLIATGFPCDSGIIAQNTVKSIGNLVGECQGVRRAGSAALDLMLVARGAFDGFFEYKLFPWDVCAGVLAVREAGGKVTDFFGKESKVFDSHFVATNGLVHEELLKKLIKP